MGHSRRLGHVRAESVLQLMTDIGRQSWQLQYFIMDVIQARVVRWLSPSILWHPGPVTLS